LQAEHDHLTSDEFSVEKLECASTSGSTGRPFFTYLSNAEDQLRKAKLLRPHVICGQKMRDRWVEIAPPWHAQKITRLQSFLGIFVPRVVSVFDSPSTQLRAIERLRPDVLDGYSSSLFMLAEEMVEKGGSSVKPRLMMGGAELIESSSRKLIEDTFHAPYYDQYGSEEFQMLAWQCPAKIGYHIDADTLVMEFVDEGGQPAAPGEKGEVVCTSLFNRAMPLLRYAVGDVGVPSEQKSCECGITFPLMKVLEGRKEQLIVLPNKRRLSPLAIGDCMCAFKSFDRISQYRFVQKRIDSFEIMVKKRGDGVNNETFAAELVAHVRRVLGIPEASINVEFFDELPLDKSGKIRKVVSELKT
jgi:phenylacetate-CoA ligase